MIEIEKTYLAKYIPEDLRGFPCVEIEDVYLPKKDRHPTLRIRNSGGHCTITKKMPLDDSDAGSQEEQTIVLNNQEFEELRKIDGKRVRKLRYYYQNSGQKMEIDVFQGELEGLVLVDVEFESEKERDVFSMPSFCLVEVTQEEAVAGGMICGKSYQEIKDVLRKYGYQKLYLK